MGKVIHKKIPKAVKDSLYTILLLFFLTSSFGVFSQKEKKIYHKAKKQLISEEYEKSKTNYLKLLELNSSKAIYYFEAGLAYYFSEKDREKGIPLFETALTKFEKDTIAETYYYLGKLYHFNHEFTKSKNTLELFKIYLSITPGGNKLSAEVEKIIANCNYAINDAAEKNIEINNLQPLNSEYPEYAPVKKPNTNVLLFTSRRKGSTGGKISYDSKYYEDIYVSVNENNNWSIKDKSEIGPYTYAKINTKFHDAAVMYSIDGQTLYLYKDAQMWQCNYKNQKWTEPVKLPFEINHKKAHVPSVAISPDGKIIYFSSNKKDGFGGKDLYYCTKSSEGIWNEPVNLGNSINTSGDEDAPFVSYDGKSLYFSSTGHEGIGNYDVFKVSINNHNYSVPENLGFPINSAADDIFFIATENEKSGYLSSNRVGGKGGMDIFEFGAIEKEKLITLKGLIYDSENGNPIGATIKMSSLDEANTLYTSPQNGRYLNNKILTDITYTIEVEAEGYQSHKLTFTIPKETNQQEVFQLITLKPLTSPTGKKYQEIASLYSILKTPNQNFVDSNITLPKSGTDDELKNISLIYNEVDNEGILTSTHSITIDTLLIAGNVSKDYPNIENIYFYFDKTNLTDSAKAELDLVIEYLKKYPDLKIELIGHADGLGDKPYNEKLSKARALSAQKYLVKNDITIQRITTKWDGASQPLAPNTLPSGDDNPSGRSKNRRVEIKIINKSMR